MAINFIMCSTLYFVFEDSSLPSANDQFLKSEGRAKKTFNRRFMD